MSPVTLKAEPYRTRRGQLMEQLSNGLILVRGGAPGRLNPNFFYLTGIEEPRGALLLAPAATRVGQGRANPGPNYIRGRMVQQILFLPSGDPLAAAWGEDSAATVEKVHPEAVGVEAVFNSAELPAVLTSALQTARRLHYIRAATPTLVGPEDADSAWVAELQRRFFHLRIEDATPVLNEMRRLKTAEEVAGIERAIDVVAEALGRAVKLIRAGAREYEVEAEIVRTYRAHGGTHAFEPIVASGPHALQLHYTENAGLLEPGHLVLIDTGVCIDGYGADITRTYPVDGRFGQRQREVYDAVLASEEAAIAECRPGALMADVHARAYQVLEQSGLGASFIHGIGHHLGIETHDVGDVHRPLDPGAVITIEPGAYLGDEGIGIRIEDDVLVEAQGSRVLSRAIPKRADEIEQRMAGGRS